MRLARSVTTNNINETPASLRAAGDRSTALTQRHRRLACRLSRGTAPLARSTARPPGSDEDARPLSPPPPPLLLLLLLLAIRPPRRARHGRIWRRIRQPQMQTIS